MSGALLQQDPPEIPFLGIFELYAQLGLVRVMEPHTEVLMRERAEQERIAHDYGPHERPWFTSFHGCLAGDTEVVTREGIKKIRDLIGTRELLVPSATKCNGLDREGRGQRKRAYNRGGFQKVQVSSYGHQELYAVKLRRGRQEKIVKVTGPHRWMLKTTEMVTTLDLEPGDKLKGIRSRRVGSIKMVPFAVAQGFVFGDGTARRLRRDTAWLDLHHNGKDECMLKFFHGHKTVEIERDGRMPCTQIQGLPRLWKLLPSFEESSAFLLSWLAGYFAADGTVSKSGQATLTSASRDAIDAARGILSICGASYGAVNVALQSGTYPQGKKYENRTMYSLNFNVRDLPRWFFVLPKHCERVQVRIAKEPGRRHEWEVVSVKKMRDREQVYCATVPSTGCFALSDELLTGNSQYPGEPVSACKRKLLYTMLDLPPAEIVPPWVTTTGKLGKAGELDLADAWFRGGRLLAVPEDPARPEIHQLGFVDNSLWFTVSTDLPILPPGWTRPHIVEVKCLAYDTLVLTECGKLPIGQIAQGSGGLELVNGRGEWQWCPVKSFGQQETYEIKLKRGNEEKTIRATGDHRWFVDKTPRGEKHAISTETTTTQLATGDKLTYRAPYSKVKKGGETRPSPFGIARGVVYGDGTVKTSGGGSMVDLFGEKDAQLLRYFEDCKVCDLVNGGKRVVDLPRYFKTDRPRLSEGVSYLYGWLAGYFAADGTVSKNGSCYLDCAQREPLEYVETLCTLLGIPTRTIYEFETGDRTSPSGNEYPSHTAYRICIQAHGLTEAFFLIEEHRRRWLGRGKESPAKRKDRWEVVDVTHGGIEEVFCAIVEDTQQFVLDGFILTGNCKADEVLEEMLQGRVLQRPDGRQEIVGRGPDAPHVNQLKATIGEAHEYDWGMASVCSRCWFIIKADIYERLGLDMGLHPAVGKRRYYCPRCDSEDVSVHTFHLERPTSGEIYYWSRSWPRKTKSFYYEYDANFMTAGRQVLAETRDHFLRNELPPRPDHFQWSVGPCANCPFKATACRPDAGVPGRKRKPDPELVRTTLSESNGVEYAMAVRPGYSLDEVRERVLQEWSVAPAQNQRQER